MLENGRLNGSLDQIELDFVEREATPAFLMKFSIQLQDSRRLRSDTQAITHSLHDSELLGHYLGSARLT